jgi:hypothetical protein
MTIETMVREFRYDEIRLPDPNPTFAISRVGRGQLLYFQQSSSKGLHYILSEGRGSSERAAMRGGGWLGRVSLS